MHNDEPTLLDTLDRNALIKEIGRAIATCDPPQVFGVHGDWGLGKTSFLRQIQWYVTADCPQQFKEEAKKTTAPGSNVENFEKTVQAVWFDAWRYQQEDAPVVALLQEMRSQLSWGQQIKGLAKRGTEVAVRGALLSIEDLTKQIGFQYSKFQDANQQWETKNLAVSLPSHMLREHLCKAIEQLLPARSKYAPRCRLAVFIDDIDRCEPEVAYRLLEGLKIYLTLDNCVFILGMNQKAVEDAIGKRMVVSSGEDPMESEAAGGRTRLRAAAYMEKLCQNVWQLPAVRNPSQVLQGLLETTINSPTIRELIVRVVSETTCLPPNPRRLKGFANLIGRLTSRLPQDLEQNNNAAIVEVQLLVIVAYIYQFHKDLYIRWEGDLDFYNRIFDRCQTGKLNSTILDSLVMPREITVTDAEPTRVTTTESTYPDPTDPHVFWIQSLILNLGSEITAQQFGPYIYGREA